ncbi:MAG: response regulator [Desulfonatronovibrionaceae bacterium]
MKILIIDDEACFVDTLTQRLKLRGYEVAGFCKAAQGLKALDEQGFDIALLDISMPEMDGMETLQIIHQNHPDLPVILLTGHATLETASRGKELGAWDYLLKPVPLDELTSRIEEAAGPRS